MKVLFQSFTLLTFLCPSAAWQVPRIDRRSFLGSMSTTTILVPLVSNAVDGDLASTLYNPDGSLRDDVAKEAKEKSVTSTWDVKEDGLIQMDGDSPSQGSQVKITYKIPEKWIATGKDLYVDPSEGVNAKAANHIYVYQAPGLVDPKQLEKASSVGVGKALKVIDDLDRVNTADLIGGRKVEKANGSLYYEFDMASAPRTCGSSDQNLGLGFCPYNEIILLSATLTEQGRLYVLAIECDNLEWKQANADLKRVRSSFEVVP